MLPTQMKDHSSQLATNEEKKLTNILCLVRMVRVI